MEAQKAVQQAVGPGEVVLWAGRPRQGLLLRKRDLGVIPFSLLWGGFTIYWEYLAVSGGAPLFFALWGVPFILVGVYLIIGRFFHDAWLRGKTVYGITRQRAVIRSGLWRRETRSYDLASLTGVSLVEHGDDREGTVHLGSAAAPKLAAWQDRLGFGTSRRNTSTSIIGPDGGGPAFDHIADAKQVFDILRDAMKRAQDD